MRPRSIAVRLVLAVAALTTVATSAPDDIVLSTTTEGTLGLGTTQISVFANRAAVDHADRLDLEIMPIGSFKDIELEDHDPAEPLRFGATDEGFLLRYSAIEVLCVRERDCDVGFTAEVPVDLDRSIDVAATVTFVRFGDSQFFFPDNPPFPDDAVIEVRIGP